MHRRLRLLVALMLTGGAASYALTAASMAGAASPTLAHSISSGFGHTCSVTGPNGAVKCWGRNDNGELGNGTTTSSSKPVGVSGLSSKVAAVSAGGSRSCALTTAGALRCWGDNPGNGASNTTTPVVVSGLASGVKAVSAGGTFTCALTTAGGVRCWGAGSLGQLGNGALTSSSVPVTPTGLGSGVAAISSGAQHSCALTTAGGIKCWGWNNYGATGDGSGATTTPEPTDVPGFSEGIMAVAVGGFHSCAITASGGAQCWGQNQVGQLGDGTLTDSVTPVSVSGLSSGVSALTGGTYHTCAITSGGAAKCWGSNITGQLGDGTTTDRSVPGDVFGLTSGIAKVSGGRFHTCSVNTAGRAQCWGSNLWGQIGDGTTVDRLTPVGVAGLSK